MSSVGRLNGKHILVVEDNFLIAEDLRQTLEAAGAERTQSVSSVKSALSAAHDQKLDGAVLDLRLRDGDCRAVAEELRRRRVPFVILTGSGKERVPAELQAAPYLAKPVSRNDLIEAAARVFA